MGLSTEPSAAHRRPECVERWPECESGAYDPRCCRFPKSCSCNVRPEEIAATTDWPQALAAVVRLSRRSLDKIGEGDWTPQDTAHWQLVRTVEEFLEKNPKLRTGRIIHGDAP